MLSLTKGPFPESRYVHLIFKEIFSFQRWLLAICAEVSYMEAWRPNKVRRGFMLRIYYLLRNKVWSVIWYIWNRECIKEWWGEQYEEADLSSVGVRAIVGGQMPTEYREKVTSVRVRSTSLWGVTRKVTEFYRVKSILRRNRLGQCVCDGGRVWASLWEWGGDSRQRKLIWRGGLTKCLHINNVQWVCTGKKKVTNSER